MLKFNYLKWILRLNKSENDFRLILALSFILGLLNIIYKFDWINGAPEASFNLWNPSWLLFGPLLYCAYRSLTGKPVQMDWKHSWHLLPFVLCGLAYLYVFFTTDMSTSGSAWKNSDFGLYQNSYGVIILSLIPYSMYVLGRILLVNTKNRADADALIISLGATYILISVILSIMILGWSGFLNDDSGIDYRYFSYGLLLFASLAILWYWTKGDKEIRILDAKNELAAQNNKSYKNSILNEDLAIEYKERVIAYFENSTLYLESSISLDFLSKELNIPKHHFSQLFSVYFGKSFHNFVADYRIMHALELLNCNNGRLKIESLAYSCGFNSKTSFNRYFKEKTGYTPSDYQIYLSRQSA
jgi:AraC-like DNA-binding protein